MSVSVSMPQLGESVTEGTVTRWLKKEGERVEADEPLLEVSTDKVDTEIPSPAAGVLRDIAVGEDETVEVGAQLAVIEEVSAASGGAAPAQGGPAVAAPEAGQPAAPAAAPGSMAGAGAGVTAGTNGSAGNQAAYSGTAAPPLAPPPSPAPPPAQQPATQAPPAAAAWPEAPAAEGWSPADAGALRSAPAYAGRGAQDTESPAGPQERQQQAEPPTQLPSGADGPYVTPLVRKLAAEHGVDLETVTGTGVGGRIRKQDVLDAARTLRAAEAAARQRQAAPAPAAPAEP
ncbi:MAG TPA: biotin/lipoyl-containing protein, partial [Streptosporangiaceae bacterium]|nr:biotin/lipoyl-containing protein [Streptosporangiaceae bacterium]